MLNAQQFPFVERYDQFGVPDAAPLLPLTLTMRVNSLQAMGLLGNLSPVAARGLVVQAKVAQFRTVDLAFAWVQTDDVPVLLGQMNFFREFDVCFYRSELAFEVRPVIKN